MKIFLIILIMTGACSRQSSKYEKIFQTTLGDETNQIGTNIPILQAFRNKQLLTDSFLIDIPEIYVHNNKLYVPDSYNKRVTVFPINDNDPNAKPSLIIPNQGRNYSFARPYTVFVDHKENIFVLASIEDIESFEIQNHTNINPNIANYEKFKEQQAKISEENFYIYKFSPLGNFLTRIGYDNQKPMPFPNKISGDKFNNLYVYFDLMSTNDSYQIMHRYNSDNGIRNFSFSSKNLDMSTNISGTNYRGQIIDIDNFKQENKLVILTEYQPTTTDDGQEVIPLIDNIHSSLHLYSILKNKFTDALINTSSITAQILGIDESDHIFFESYDPESNNLKIRMITTKTSAESVYFAPIHSSYYTMNDYLIDEKGTLYNSILDRKEKFILLRWDNKIVNKKGTK